LNDGEGVATITVITPKKRSTGNLIARLDRPLSTSKCVAGWIVATILFIGINQLLGGPAPGDSEVFVYSAWSIAHGHLACAYPPASSIDFPLIAPLYPLLLGGLSALLRIGHSVPFPSPNALGHGCTTAVTAMTHWSHHAGAVSPTLDLGYLGWIVLLFGIVSFLRSIGRGRSGWEPVTLIAVACAPPVFMCVQSWLHPQDLIAMGLVLGAMSFIRRDSWVWAGILLGLAVMSQQFALLVIAPLLVLVPSDKRVRFVASIVWSSIVIVTPLALATSGRALKAAFIGSGFTPAERGTYMSELHLHGTIVLTFSRLLPIVAALALARWAARRLGPAVFEPVAFVSVIAASLSFRLIFEENLWGYYLMAVTVLVILTDVIRRRFRWEVVGWLAVAFLAYYPLPWGYDPLNFSVPDWIWQVALCPAAVALAVGPLISEVRAHVRADAIVVNA
jgi:hypothetical protein